jgi:HEAT repeat protein
LWRITRETDEPLRLLISSANDQATRDINSRQQAIAALGTMGRAAEPAIPALRADLTDDFPVIRNAAAVALAHILRE